MIKKTIKRCIFGGYLGFALRVFTGFGITKWQFYAVLIPTIILVSWGDEDYRAWNKRELK